MSDPGGFGPPEPGGRIGPYQITGRMGAGGMGVVYAGTAADGARVAVKVIHPGLAADPQFLARFIREVDLLSRVRGRCTVSVLASDTTAVPPWLATEFVPGPTLSDHVRDRGPLRPDELLSFGVDIAEALTDIHRAGIVHRDLKPGNVILAASGAKVLDFGIARALDESGLTGTGALIGTPGWISPEQYRGDPADAAADVFAWGALMAYAATGRPPFGIGAPDVLAYRVMSVDPDLSGVPSRIRDLVRDALAKERAARPAAHQLLAQITALRAGGTLPLTHPPHGTLPLSRPPHGTEPLSRPPHGAGPLPLSRPPHGRRLALPLWSAAAVVATVATIGVVFALSSARTPEAIESPDDVSSSTYSESHTPSEETSDEETPERTPEETPTETPEETPTEKPAEKRTAKPTPRKTRAATVMPCASERSILDQAAASNGGSLPDDVVVTRKRCAGNWVAAELDSPSVGGIDLIAKRNATRFVAAEIGSNFCSADERPALLASAPAGIKAFLCPNGFG
ncbi:serine/threonine-protein kinase [Nonomuraea zeae]|uniref:serine/threonine-protein kinase n=1 Tax=Nonomuraea zeae TaxID=1642303 RepID=UPI00197DE9F9|nr:serine/threonine-protein kinase [Nonomuraea zeae]